MAKHHTYSIEFKRQVAQEYIAGETLHALAKRHDLVARFFQERANDLNTMASTNKCLAQNNKSRMGAKRLRSVKPATRV